MKKSARRHESHPAIVGMSVAVEVPRLFFRRPLFLLIDAYGQFGIVYTIIGLEVAGVPVLGCYQRAATAIRSGKESYWRRLVHSVRWLRCLLFDSFFDEPCWSLPRGRASLLSANLS